MKRKLIYIIVTTLGVFGSALGFLPHKGLRDLSFVTQASFILPIPDTKFSTHMPLIKAPLAKAQANQKPAIPMVVNKLAIKQIPFHQLPGWEDADVKKSLTAFKKSCETFLKKDPQHPVGSTQIDLKAKDWQPACRAALSIDAAYEEDARQFFEKWFYPIEFGKKEPVKGVFTGYYTPQVKGSLTRSQKYNTPIYGLPNDLRWKRNTYYTREQIDKGVLNHKAPVIAWINSPVDRLFLEIEGAAVVKLNTGKDLYLSYAGENGAPYTSVGSVLIKKGIMNKDNASKKAIKRYLSNNPNKVNPILHQNKSFVFFQNLKKKAALGAQGMALTPGYSLAIDRKWIPLGAPLWLVTKVPDQNEQQQKQFKRLMIAQDTGGAIRGLVRGDIYWGASEKAAYLGEHMKNQGRYWLLLPKHAVHKIQYNYFSTKVKLVVQALKHWPAWIKHSIR
ncbi:murein transglycosylase A [Legionella birminghamensis]|nr:MltA domain-containing protein [Legionella birminghamensis]